MPGTMTYVGFDVHARSTHAAAIDVMGGELTRMRFGRDRARLSGPAASRNCAGGISCLSA